MAFVDLEKAFDPVPRKAIWLGPRKLGVEEWIVRLVQGMYANVQSHVRVGEGYSEEFKVKVDVHQGSVLSPLLFILLEAWEFRSGVPWKDLYADDLVIIAERMCQEALDLEKSNGNEKTETQERWRSWPVVWAWTSCRVQANFHAPSVTLEWAATSFAMAASTGCTRKAVGSRPWQRTLATDVHGARELHVPWMADNRRKSRLDLTS